MNDPKNERNESPTNHDDEKKSLINEILNNFALRRRLKKTQKQINRIIRSNEA